MKERKRRRYCIAVFFPVRSVTGANREMKGAVLSFFALSPYAFVIGVENGFCNIQSKSYTDFVEPAAFICFIKNKLPIGQPWPIGAKAGFK